MKNIIKNQNISKNLSNFINMNKPEIIVDCDAGNMLGEIPKPLLIIKKNQRRKYKCIYKKMKKYNLLITEVWGS